MCGIAGSFLFGPSAASDPQDPDLARHVATMLRALVHRGPDAEKLDRGADGVLGFRRLAILDLSPAGDQPHRIEGGGVASMVNGEIYNYKALRAELEAAGVRLHSTGDAEIVPHLYRRDGDEFVARLEGMFALALIDRTRRRLILCRDRFGKKPVYFRIDGGRIDFASEPAALIAAGAPFTPDPSSIVSFLALSFVAGPRSTFATIERLMPGEMLIAENGTITRKRWYAAPPATPVPSTLDAAAKRTWELLVPAVSARFASDVPVGVFLSGGIDSGLIAAAAREGGFEPLCFTIGFRDGRYDERELAAATARHLGLDLRVREIELDPSHAIDRVAAAFDEPFGDSSALPTLLLCEETRKSVKVALSGDGGDEAFAGYKRHRALVQLESIDSRIPRFLEFVPRALAALLREPGNGVAGRSLLGQIRRFVTALPMDSASRNTYWSSCFSAALRARFFHPELLAAVGDADPDRESIRAFQALRGTTLHCALGFDLSRYLPDDLLVKTDRASMAHSLEVRCPLLDHRVVEFARTIPDSVLQAGGATKAVLRRLAHDKLPPAVARASKRGFGVPLAEWLRGPLRGIAEERLLSESFAERKILKDGAARELLVRHRSGREDWSAYLWNLLQLDAWFRRFDPR